MLELGLRRHFGLKAKDWNQLLLEIEKVDNYLSLSKSYEMATAAIVVYGEFENSEFLVGREVVGLDMEFAHHEQVVISNFDAVSAQEFFISSLADIDLAPWLQKKCTDLGLTHYRVEIHQMESALCCFFNLEK